MAGLFTAIKAGEKRVTVTLVDKGYIGKSGASIFGGGFYGYYSVFNPAWGHHLGEWMAHIHRTGEYINNPEWTEIALKDSYERYRDLVSWDVKFERNPDGDPCLFRENGPLEALKMKDGRTTPMQLRKQVQKRQVRIIDRIMVTDLLKQDGKVIGAVAFHTWSGDLYIFLAKATIITSGSGSFKQMGFPIAFLTSDGEAMAYRAGAEISSKEFWHTHSNAYYEERANTKVSMNGYDTKIADFSPGWITYGNPAARFCRLVDAEGFEVGRPALISAVHSGRAPILWDLDVASQADIESMLQDLKASGNTRRLERAGIDLKGRGKVPGLVGSAAFLGYAVNGGTGGISAINSGCATSISGLYAAGDSCDTRVVGARYPSFGFGLRTASVTGARAGESGADYASKIDMPEIGDGALSKFRDTVYAPMERKGGFSPSWAAQQLQNLMVPYYIWSVRHGDRLNAALTLVEFLKNHIAPRLTAKDPHELRSAHETKSMILNAELMLRSALFRTESRGSHYREDYPKRDDPDWLAWVIVKKVQGEMTLKKEVLPKKWWPDLSKPYAKRYPNKFLGE